MGGDCKRGEREAGGPNYDLRITRDEGRGQRGRDGRWADVVKAGVRATRSRSRLRGAWVGERGQAGGVGGRAICSSARGRMPALLHSQNPERCRLGFWVRFRNRHCRWMSRSPSVVSERFNNNYPGLFLVRLKINLDPAVIANPREFAFPFQEERRRKRNVVRFPIGRMDDGYFVWGLAVSEAGLIFCGPFR